MTAVAVGLLFGAGVVTISSYGVGFPILGAGGLLWFYYRLFLPITFLFIAVFLYSYTRERVGDRILYLSAALMLIPITFYVAQMSPVLNYGTGGGRMYSAWIFMGSWPFLLIGGLLKPRRGIPLILVGAVLNFAPYGIGVALASLSYMLRANQFSRGFFVAAGLMLAGFLIGLYFILLYR